MSVKYLGLEEKIPLGSRGYCIKRSFATYIYIYRPPSVFRIVTKVEICVFRVGIQNMNTNFGGEISWNT
jgi:hypothetical protein